MFWNIINFFLATQIPSLQSIFFKVLDSAATIVLLVLSAAIILYWEIQ